MWHSVQIHACIHQYSVNHKHINELKDAYFMPKLCLNQLQLFLFFKQILLFFLLEKNEIKTL